MAKKQLLLFLGKVREMKTGFHFRTRLKNIIVFLIFICSFGATVVFAQEFRSANFVDSNPVVTMGGGKSTSTNFQLFSGAGQVIIGQSSSSAFISNAGFFYFPFITTPVISATAGDAQASLTWTSAVGELGFNITAYSIGQSTNSGGPYSFTNVGNILNKTVAGLTNGITYYFVVRALDFFGDPVATSTQVSATPVAPSPALAPVPSGGGGALGYTLPVTGVIFSGRAYPESFITLLKDAQVAVKTIAGPDSNFEISLTGLSGGSYIFSLYGEDKNGIKSALFTFPVTITIGAMTRVSGIFIAPTISVDKSEVKRGDNIAIFGQSVPVAQIVISVNSDEEIFIRTVADKNGVYLYNFDTSPLDLGSHLAKSKAALGGEISSYSKAVGFLVGNKTVSSKPIGCPKKADLNNDCKVNLIDFSIAAYWHKRPISQSFALIEKAKLNGDGKISLIDFSIMAFYWTG